MSEPRRPSKPIADQARVAPISELERELGILFKVPPSEVDALEANLNSVSKTRVRVAIALVVFGVYLLLLIVGLPGLAENYSSGDPWQHVNPWFVVFMALAAAAWIYNERRQA